jgi:hypothetical protein
MHLLAVNLLAHCPASFTCLLFICLLSVLPHAPACTCLLTVLPHSPACCSSSCFLSCLIHLLAVHLLACSPLILLSERLSYSLSIPTCSLNCFLSRYPASPARFSLFTISCLISSHFCLLPCLTCSLQSSVSSICCSSKPLMFTVLPSSLPPFLLAVFPHLFTVKPLLFATFPSSVYFLSLSFYFRLASDFSWFALMGIKQKIHILRQHKSLVFYHLQYMSHGVYCLLHSLSKHMHLETSSKKI